MSQESDMLKKLNSEGRRIGYPKIGHFGRADCFELKAVKTQKTQGRLYFP